jgi:hypothetical protein
MAATKNFNEFLAGINDSIGLKNINIKSVNPDFSGAIKGKSSLAAMQASINDLIASSKIEANNNEKDLRFNINLYQNTVGDFSFLFNDLAEIINNESDVLRSIVIARISDFEKSEAEREAAVIAANQKTADTVVVENKKPELVKNVTQIIKASTEKASTTNLKQLHQDAASLAALADDLGAIHLPEGHEKGSEIVVEEIRLAINDSIESITQLLLSLKQDIKKAG